MAGSTTLSYSTCYNSGTLSVETVTDEDGKTHSVYKDATGKIVLERSASNHDTYYVYDDMNRLRFVLPPCASDVLASTASWNMESNDVLRNYAYYYEYDGRGRCVKKKLPGTEHVLYEYDIRDRMTFSQDGVQRSSGKWTFYVYDNLNRLVQQGENASKAVAASGVYLQNYYDNYDFVGDIGFTDDRFVDDTSGNAKGSITGTVMNVFGSSEKIYTAYYYDTKGRVRKTVENNLMGGYNTTETTYTFTNQPETVSITHTASGKLTQTEVYTYTYDSIDRISSVNHKLNNGSAVTLASYTYDNVGRVATKKLHGSSSNQLTYAYNVRSWLTGISSGKFSQNLTYNNGSTGFNGNITAMNWDANGSAHAYNFTYDGMNRLQNAVHGTGAYTERVTGYDKNGNITGLQRYNNGTLVDNLSYTYNGNQLTKVEDATGNATGFTNGASQTNEYTYDHNGNLTKDLNKNISNIQYNSLNLPSVVTFSNGNTITYLYAADGRKLRTVHVINGFSFTTDYSGNVIYENGSQKLLLTEEGYIDLIGGNAYYYYLKDHQGNNRVVLSSSGTVAETNHYYPFGGLFATSSSSVQPYKYNGKELDTKNGLNWYDYGARHYDAALGRWHVVDPLAETFYSTSLYGYCDNNPIRYIDPTGEAWKPIYTVDNKGNKIYNGYEWIPESESYNKDGSLKNGLYSQAIFFSDNGTFDSSKRYNMGSSTAYVYLADGSINTFEANTHPSSEDYAIIPEGVYHAKVGIHNGSQASYTALRMSDVDNSNRIELGKVNPTFEDGRTYAIGINIHKPGLNNLTGMTNSGTPVSEGCLLIDRNKWNDFIGIFDTTKQRPNQISVIVSRSLKRPLNYKKK